MTLEETLQERVSLRGKRRAAEAELDLAEQFWQARHAGMRSASAGQKAPAIRWRWCWPRPPTRRA